MHTRRDNDRAALTAEQPCRRLYQDAPARSLNRRPGHEQIEQVTIVRHDLGSNRRMRPVAAPQQALRIGGNQRIVKRPRVFITGELRRQPIRRGHFHIHVTVANQLSSA